MGASYFRITDVDEGILGGFFALREDLDTYSIRGQGSAGQKNIFFSLEYAQQSGYEDIFFPAMAQRQSLEKMIPITISKSLQSLPAETGYSPGRFDKN